MIRIKYMISAFSAILLAGLIGLGTPVVASTPDGTTPANEGVCDVLIGATPGLFGLCNAYCEAQDLDDFDKEPPRTKILANYNKKKQASDPDMPCLQTPCPCWTADELASVNDAGTAGCNRLGTTIQIVDNSPLHLADANTEQSRCRYIDTGVAPPTVRIFSITQDEVNGCFAEIDAVCTSIGQ